MSKLFGTDGVRGVAGTPPLDPVTVTRLGAALVRVLPHRGAGTRAGRAGHARVGRLDRAGAGPRRRQPGRAARHDRHRADAGGGLPDRLARLRRRAGDLGLAQSVSGQRHQDLLRATARSSPRRRSATSRRWSPTRRSSSIRRRRRRSRARISSTRISITRARCCRRPARCAARRIGLDCANGATATVAPRLFRALGFDVVVIGAEPDGRNINLECGSTHPECLSALVAEGEAPLRRGVRRRRRSRHPDRRRRARRRRRRRALPVRPAHARRRPPARATPSSPR